MRVDCTESPPEDWDPAVEAFAHATPYHSGAAVQISNAVFGHRTWFLTARSDGRICGVLPLVEQSSFLFGRFLTSLPYVNYGGLLAAQGDAADALLAEARRVATERRVRHLELRHLPGQPRLDLPERTDKVTMILDLAASEDMLARQLGSKLRSQIRRAERESPEVQWGSTELLDDFYRVFSLTMHALGTPVLPLKFFRVFLDAMGAQAKVLVIRSQGDTEAASIVVHHRDRIEVPWAAATETAKRGALNMRLYWEMLRYTLDTGLRRFDFGRCTPGSGTHRFKAQWGALPLQLHWAYVLPPGAEPPLMNAANPKFALAAQAWRRLPAWAANRLGPMLIRGLP